MTVTTLGHETIFSVNDISLSFKGIKAISNLSFSVLRGEICALIGPNGAGKSSLLNILNGVYRANSGEVIYDQIHFSKIEPYTAAQLGIGRTFQNNALFKNMSVLDNILTGLSRHAKSGFLAQAFKLKSARKELEQFKHQAESVIHFLELEAYREKMVGSLSYGLQKRVELGRTLVAGPRLLLLDEPMAGMNADEKQDMTRFIRDINRELSTTIVLIEHDIDIVMNLASHIVVLDYGRKVGDGTPVEVQANPEVIAAYLGQTQQDTP